MMDLFAGDPIDQFRLVRFQVYNWGTFSGLHDIPIAREGHLFIGGSGSGKSTLLDAMSVLLTPGMLNFNAAARQNEKRGDRTLASYMRGAWTSQLDDEGRSVLQYLRKKSTWSAIALTYRSDVRTVTLLFVATLRGTGNEDAKINRRYYVLEDSLDLLNLADFAKDYDWGTIKKAYPAIEAFSRFSPYCECFRQKFGIESEQVLKLLNKAQSARNLGDLSQFLRKFMLDEPKTFQVADLLVGEFTPLFEAHETVVKARKQVEFLREAKAVDDKRRQAVARVERLAALQDAIEPWTLMTKKGLIEAILPQDRQAEESSKLKYEATVADYERQSEKLEAVKREYMQQGGDRIAGLEAEIKALGREMQHVMATRERMGFELSPLGLALPENGEAFAALRAKLSELVKTLGDEQKARREVRDQEVGVKSRKTEEFQELLKEIEAMQTTRSNIPWALTKLRSNLAQALGVAESALPFAGELIEVKDEERSWQGAIERVLHNFATSLLVSEALYQPVAKYVNEHDLKARLVYLRVPQEVAAKPKALSEEALPGKLNMKPGDFQAWLENELAARFDYACVRSERDFARFERAVTLAGQIKHNRVRHEKDDRRALNDKKSWVLGFSNEEKLASYQEAARVAATELSELERRILDLDHEINGWQAKESAASRALKYEFSEIDRSALALDLKVKNNELEKLRAGTQTLQAVAREKEALEKVLAGLDGQKQENYSRWQEARRQLTAREDELARLVKMLEKEPAEDDRLEELTDWAHRIRAKIRLEDLSSVRDKLTGEILRESRTKNEDAARWATDLGAKFSRMKVLWPEVLPTLDATVQSAPEYFDYLRELEEDGLPGYEKKFKEMLTSHTRQNLSDLFITIGDERRKIKQRLQEVNQCLAQVAFNRLDGIESHLRIDVRDKHLPEVAEYKEFHQAITQMEHFDMTLEHAERYFEKINALVQKLKANGGDAAAQHWRERVLDIREQMEFIGKEFTLESDGTENLLEVYDGTSGKSGGQRQKLTVVCLAAALRYQLGGRESDYPSYAPVILDEAFDKADAEFTDIALTIFRDFHFQLIIATPEKSVATFDPYVGGVSYVTCKNRSASSVLPVIYDAKTGQFNEATESAS
ncbi:MAG TPA: ATP-binding protein [Candidatus Aphodousia gallistercoris]|nr:ATP-binding protein [Candidatus Aphodousia gallistercoris]